MIKLLLLTTCTWLTLIISSISMLLLALNFTWVFLIRLQTLLIIIDCILYLNYGIIDNIKIMMLIMLLIMMMIRWYWYHDVYDVENDINDDMLILEGDEIRRRWHVYI